MGKNASHRDVPRHRTNRMPQSQITTACGCARSTVQDVLKKAAAKGVSWDDVAGLSEQAAYGLVRGGPQDHLFDTYPVGEVRQYKKPRRLNLG